MSDQDNLSETSTLEMKTERNFNKILNAIGDMRQEFSYRFDGLEKKVENIEKKVENIETEQAEMNNFMNVQFEAIRQGIFKNYNQFDRLEAQIAENRAVIFTTKALLEQFKIEFTAKCPTHFSLSPVATRNDKLKCVGH